MRTNVARFKGLAFIIWHARHEFYHILLGLIWAWILREAWNVFNPRLIVISVIGSLIPDLDHLYFFTTYGRKDFYTQNIKSMLKKHQWRALTVFLERGHKNQTNLSLHNIYFMIVLIALSIISSAIDWEAGVILFGAMIIHYLFDIADDLLVLGSVNPNWKRWGHKKDKHLREHAQNQSVDLS